MKTKPSATFLAANLGSEVSRLFSNVERGERRMAEGAVRRANGIIEKLLNNPEMQYRSREIEILREIISDRLSEEPRLQVRKEEIEDYFMPFAMRALREQGLF